MDAGTSYGGMRRWALTAALGGMFLALGNAQETGELVALGRKNGVGARAVGMGEAFTAVADDYTALYYNPAGMTQLGRSEAGLSLRYGMSGNDASFQGGFPSSRTLESTRLNAFGMVLSDGGPWALGMGYYSPVSYDDPLAYVARGSEYDYEASGQLEQYRLALAYRVSPEASFGVGVSALSGEQQLEIDDNGAVRYLDDYSGWNVEPSFLFHLSDGFSIGGSAVVMERLELDDTYQQQGGSPLETVYEIQHPFQAKLGLAYRAGLTQLSADWRGDFWSTYRYRLAGAAYDAPNLNYPNQYLFSIGLEQRLEARGPVLRLGYTWENRDEQRFQPGDRSPFRVSAGLGMSPSRNVTLDLAYQYGSARSFQNSTPNGPSDLRIDGADHQVLASLRLRW